MHLLSHLLKSMGWVTPKSTKIVKFPDDAFTDLDFPLSCYFFVLKRCFLTFATAFFSTASGLLARKNYF